MMKSSQTSRFLYQSMKPAPMSIANTSGKLACRESRDLKCAPQCRRGRICVLVSEPTKVIAVYNVYHVSMQTTCMFDLSLSYTKCILEHTICKIPAAIWCADLSWRYMNGTHASSLASTSPNASRLWQTTMSQMVLLSLKWLWTSRVTGQASLHQVCSNLLATPCADQ